MAKIRNSRKKGFTLIELMVAIAFLAIIYPAITSAFLTAQKAMEDENSRLETIAQAQYMMQVLQVEGRDGVEHIYNKYKSADTAKASLFIFYGNNEDISNTVGNTADEDKAKSDILYAEQSSDDEPDSTTAQIVMDAEGVDTPYAAHVLIVLDAPPTGEPSSNYFSVYKVVVDTWKMKGAHPVGSRRMAYIGE
jgi:prepilin-type N-terminal cleavage/methylation domain